MFHPKHVLIKDEFQKHRMDHQSDILLRAATKPWYYYYNCNYNYYCYYYIIIIIIIYIPKNVQSFLKILYVPNVSLIKCSVQNTVLPFFI